MAPKFAVRERVHVCLHRRGSLAVAVRVVPPIEVPFFYFFIFLFVVDSLCGYFSFLFVCECECECFIS